MGVTSDTFAFDGDPPSRDTFLEALRARLDDTSGIASYEVVGRRVLVSCLHDEVTHPYACATLLALGGQPVHHVTGAAIELALPDFAARPWSTFSWWQRLRIRWRWARSLRWW